jgi:hypothetical protein
MAIGMATAVGAAQDLGLSGVGDLLVDQQKQNPINQLRKRKANQKSPLAALEGRGDGAFADLTQGGGIFDRSL